MLSAQGLTVLIAEDSAADRLLLAAIVRRQGHEVLLAANGAEAVALFLAHRPQLVLMDAIMPVMDGFEATRQIKAPGPAQLRQSTPASRNRAISSGGASRNSTWCCPGVARQ